ncbi:SulP family inorganic anion transporter [Microbacterium foliorum]|uniref:SulP family inorganic anion transporter n=2 Tax=Microbacterium foliorum TaxID=104336 RepID=A0A4Y5YW23_9MICO|nr:SulP family inorganic anion transporter [Microbacterium foliorum]
MRFTAGWRRYRQRFGTRATIGKDLRAGVVLGVESVPDGLAAGLLAGVNPVLGLNAYIVGTLFGALATGSVFMTVQATGAMAVIIADVPEIQGTNASAAVATLTVMAGIVMLALGLAGLGSLIRFIPAAVLIGFVNAVAVNIVLSQLANLTGYASDADNRLARTWDSALNFGQMSWESILVGSATVAVILVLERTRLGALSMVVGIVAGSILAVLLPPASVAVISDVAEVTRALPALSLPDISMVFGLLIPALSLALVGLVQGAAISGSIPNPDGKYPNASADFRGQGIANIASGVMQGIPVGGSMSATALSRAAGARSASANLIACGVMLASVLAFAPLIGYTAMPALAGLLMVVGVRTFKLHQLIMVARTGAVPATVCAVTFILTVVIPLQYAVLAGVGLAVVLHIARQSNRVRVRRLLFDDTNSRPIETAAPAVLTPGDVVVLTAYGSLFFASSASFRDQLPDPGHSAPGAYVVIRLRGTDELGVTFLTMLRVYARELASADAHLMIAGIGARVRHQMEITGVAEVIGTQNIFAAEPRVGDAVARALDAIDSRRREDESD